MSISSADDTWRNGIINDRTDSIRPANYLEVKQEKKPQILNRQTVPEFFCHSISILSDEIDVRFQSIYHKLKGKTGKTELYAWIH